MRDEVKVEGLGLIGSNLIEQPLEEERQARITQETELAQLRNVLLEETKIDSFTARKARRAGLLIKVAGQDVYQDAEIGSLWKISEDGKHVLRLFEDDSGLAKEASIARATDYVVFDRNEIIDGPYVKKSDLDKDSLTYGKLVQLQDLPESVLKKHNIKIKSVELISLIREAQEDPEAAYHLVKQFEKDVKVASTDDSELFLMKVEEEVKRQANSEGQKYEYIMGPGRRQAIEYIKAAKEAGMDAPKWIHPQATGIWNEAVETCEKQSRGRADYGCAVAILKAKAKKTGKPWKK